MTDAGKPANDNAPFDPGLYADLVTAATDGDCAELSALLRDNDVPQGVLNDILMQATAGRKSGTVRIILEHGGDASFQEGGLLSFAAGNGDRETVDALIEYGAGTEKTLQKAIKTADDMERYDVAHHLVAVITDMQKKGKCLERDEYKTLFEERFGADFTLDDLKVEIDETGMTGFMLAARGGVFDRVAAAALKGARGLEAEDLLRKDEDDKTAVDALIENGGLESAFNPRLWAGREDGLQQVFNASGRRLAAYIDCKEVLAQARIMSGVKNRARNTPRLGK